MKFKKLNEINLKSGIERKINLKDIKGDNLFKEIEEEIQELGLEIEVKQIQDPEKFVKNYYEKKGYDVTKLNPHSGGCIDPITCKKIREKYGSSERLVQKGIPDFLVIDKEDEHYFFVEAKNEKDNLSIDQIRWIFVKHSEIPVRICHTVEGETK